MIYLGIDPGVSGGIAVLNQDKVLAFSMPASERDLWELIHEYGMPTVRHPKHGPVSYAVMEKVSGVISASVGLPNMGASQFTFGRNYGTCLGMLIAAGIPFDLVHPRRWQKEFDLSRHSAETRTRWKNRLKSIAQRLFPYIKVTLAISDALLIAEFARRTYGTLLAGK